MQVWRIDQFLYPNRVAVVKSSGGHHCDRAVASPPDSSVRPVRPILLHPRGVTVDNKGRIIVVECKVMRVIIFDQLGNALHKFGCSKHLEFPNGVVVNDKQEIFISDNRAHCVKVFSHESQFLRQSVGKALTNYSTMIMTCTLLTLNVNVLIRQHSHKNRETIS